MHPELLLSQRNILAMLADLKADVLKFEDIYRDGRYRAAPKRRRERKATPRKWRTR